MVIIVTIIIGAAVLYTGVDPVMVTEYSVVFSAIALPLTYLPILIVANDSEYMGDDTNGRATNVLASLYLVIILVAALAAIPLMIVTGAVRGECACDARRIPAVAAPGYLRRGLGRRGSCRIRASQAAHRPHPLFAGAAQRGLTHAFSRSDRGEPLFCLHRSGRTTDPRQ